MKNYDLAVFGCGSGGFGAALAAARAGLEVVVIEKTDSLGGNANFCGVNNWEPVAGATGIPFEIYKRLKEHPSAVGIYGYGRHFLWDGRDAFPGGEHTLESATGKGYRDTLRRHGAKSITEDREYIKNNLFGVVFEPLAYEKVLRSMLTKTGRCEVLHNTTFTEVIVNGGHVDGVVLDNGQTLAADYYVDATGDGDLCAASGCEVMIGQESRDLFNEPSAPEQANNKINGVSLIFRITPKNTALVDPLPDGIQEACWWQGSYPFAACFQFPNGDFNVNTLPTMDGREYLDMGHAAATKECKRRIRSWWYYVQRSYPEMQSYTIHSVSPSIGVRESRRIVGEYILTQHDCVGGISAVHDDCVAISDHQLDRHGGDTLHAEIPEPYGIPYRCLLPKGFSNLLVACRAASFNSVAATSCRLSRTMIHLGQAAGTAAVIAARNRADLRSVPAEELRADLRRQHVQLAWPTDYGLRDYLASE